MNFKTQFSPEERLLESSRIRDKFPGRIPVIVEKSRNASPHIPTIDKSKFLVPADLTISQFIFVIRKRIHLQSETALFLFVAGTLPTTALTMRELYSIHHESDGFLYAQYTGENTFGAN